MAEETGQKTGSFSFHSVARLKALLDMADPEAGIAMQAVATNGDAWNMWGLFVPKMKCSEHALLQLYHPEMKFMHSRFNEEQLGASLEALKGLISNEESVRKKTIMVKLLGAVEEALSELNQLQQG